jgi:hypothetical protein
MSGLYKQAEETDAAQLQLGRDFDDEGTMCLMNDEIMVLLRREAEKGNSSETGRQTLDYLRKVSGVADDDILREASAEIRAVLMGGQGDEQREYRCRDQSMRNLHMFEVAQLGNLIATEATVDEVVAWIPSLANLDEHELEKVLEEIANAKSRLQ